MVTNDEATVLNVTSFIAVESTVDQVLNWYVHLHYMPSNMVEKTVVDTSKVPKTSNNTSFWHKRLVHQNEGTLRSLKTFIIEMLKLAESCKLATPCRRRNAKKKSFESHINNIMIDVEVVSKDLFETPADSTDESKCFYTFIYYFSRFITSSASDQNGKQEMPLKITRNFQWYRSIIQRIL